MEAVHAAYEGGATLAQLSRRFAVPEETLRRHMKRAGIELRPRGYPVGKHRPAGGRTLDADGYVLIRKPDHPFRNSSGYVREHRLVMEQSIGRYLKPQEVVHHVNGLKDDNRPENLRLYADNAAHKRDDMRGNSWSLGDVGNPKRVYRKRRTDEELLQALAEIEAALGRDIRRVDLKPPNPSYRAVGRAFGSWRHGVNLARRRACLIRWARTPDPRTGFNDPGAA